MKKLLTLLAVIALILSGNYIYQKATKTVEKQIVNQITVDQLISKDSQRGKYIFYRISSGTTALDLLKKNTQLKIKGEGVNAYVVSINGKEAMTTKKEYWAFYINGKPATAGAGSYKLKQGDKIEWKIEKY